MTRRENTSWTFSNDPLRGILVTLGWSDMAEPDREPFDRAGEQGFAQDHVIPLRGASYALMSATTITLIDPEREPIAS